MLGSARLFEIVENPRHPRPHAPARAGTESNDGNDPLVGPLQIGDVAKRALRQAPMRP